MPDEFNQKISQFLDNELTHIDGLKLLNQLSQHSSLDQKLRRYEIISSVMKNDTVIAADEDFVKRVTLKIQQEPVVFTPIKPSKYRFTKPILAIAATVAVMAVLFVQGKHEPVYIQQDPVVVAENQQASKTTPSESINTQPIDTRFYDYLKAHRGNLYTAEPATQPYAKLAGYGQN